jgi:glyoxylase-like metal-dependent hydrolase (beta-lactamase superfamily II)
MLEIYKIPVVTPYPVGPVNSYLIKSEPYTLLDPGPATPAAKRSLIAGLLQYDVELNDIQRVVLSHSHLDHSGLAQWMHRLAGVEICLHHLELRKLSPDYDFYLERLAFFQEAGLPAGALYEILSDFDPVEKAEPFSADATLLKGDETLSFADGELIVKHFPGHSDGHICLYDEEKKHLLAGDFILKEITPNPNMEPNPEDFTQRLPTLTQYIEGLNRLEELEPKKILPGHGGNIDDSREAVAVARKHHQARLELVYQAIKEQSKSVYQLMRVFYPDIKGFEIYLGISEIYSHVDYLVAQGRITREKSGAISMFSA